MKITLAGYEWETADKEAPYTEATIEIEDGHDRVKVSIDREYVFISKKDWVRISKSFEDEVKK